MHPEPPPGGADLYECLRSAFPETWGQLIHGDEDELFRGEPPFELGMRALWDSGDARAQALITQMALYFRRFQLGGRDNCYSRLLTILSQRKLNVAFATLNYECLLEMAISHSWGGVNCLLSGNPGTGVPVMKLHGSCNFVSVMIDQMHGISMQGVGAGYYQGPLKAVDPQQVASYYTAPNIPPAISLFSSGKPSPVSPEEIGRIRDHWKRSVEQAEVTIVIGARPVLADDHVWEPVLTSSGDVWHVGGTSGRDFAAYADRLGARLETLGDRFDQVLTRLGPRFDILG